MSAHDARSRTGCSHGGLIDRTQPLALHASTARRYRGYRRRHAGLGAARQRRAAGRPLASSITGRAASSPPARRSRTRWSSCAPARGASRTRSATDGRALRRARGREPEPLAVAALRPAGGQLAARAVPRRRLLLQDLHVAGGVLGEGLRAADPPRRRPRPRRRRSRSGPLREGARLLRRAGRSAPARPGWRRRWPPAEPARA